MEDCCS